MRFLWKAHFDYALLVALTLSFHVPAFRYIYDPVTAEEATAGFLTNLARVPLLIALVKEEDLLKMTNDIASMDLSE